MQTNAATIDPTVENMKKRIQHLPKESFLDKLLYYYDNEREEYYRNVFNL